jgi:hypothetical protein
MSDERFRSLDDSDYEALAAEIREELDGTAVTIPRLEDQHDIPAEAAGKMVDEADWEEVAKEIAEEMQAEREPKAIPEEHKDKGKRLLEVLKRAYSEGTWAVAFWISFTLSGLTLALYLLVSYAPLLLVSTIFALAWFVLLVISSIIGLIGNA